MDTITLDVFRYRPEQEDEPTFQQYEVPYREEWVVLDALNYVKDQIDGTLTYRWSCRMGVCGSCGMMVNGEPNLTCAAFLRDYHPESIRVEPLNYFPVIRDLVINMEDFLHKLNEVKAWLVPKQEKPVSEGEYLQTPAELARYSETLIEIIWIGSTGRSPPSVGVVSSFFSTSTPSVTRPKTVKSGSSCG